MSDHYLWDKTGEVDPEIEELERLLSTFSYQPRTIEIPAAVAKERSRFFLPLTIAATVALLILGIGIWSNINRTKQPELAAVPPRPTDTTAAPSSSDKTLVSVTEASDTSPNKPDTARPARKKSRPSHGFVREAKFTAGERLEAENAKEQLLIGLRLASSKLNLAQKRTQGIQPSSPIRYQHKNG
jgi:cytoskeletal protein RodZ